MCAVSVPNDCVCGRLVRLASRGPMAVWESWANVDTRTPQQLTLRGVVAGPARPRQPRAPRPGPASSCMPAAASPGAASGWVVVVMVAVGMMVEALLKLLLLVSWRHPSRLPVRSKGCQRVEASKHHRVKTVRALPEQEPESSPRFLCHRGLQEYSAQVPSRSDCLLLEWEWIVCLWGGGQGGAERSTTTHAISDVCRLRPKLPARRSNNAR